MTNFVYDGVALPDDKMDFAGGSSPIANPTHFWSPNDSNRVFSALKDCRTAILNYTVNAKQFGAVGDGATNDTAAIQLALDTVAARGGGFAGGARGACVFLPASPTPYMFSNLVLPGYVSLVGEHMSGCCLKRLLGSTGIAIRERNLSEAPGGDGGSGTWIRHLRIDGNGTSGDGINLGNQGVSFNFLAGLQNVSVFNFPSGTGIKLNTNAISCHYLWANACATGIQLNGGGSVYHSLWAENNTTNDVVIAGQGDSYFGIQVEPLAGSTPTILVTGSDNNIMGVYVGLLGNRSELVKNAIGANRNSYRKVVVVANGHTFTNLILNEAYSGTGSSVFDIDEYVMGENSGAARYFINQSTGTVNSVIADATLLGGTLQVTGSIGFYNHAPAAKPTVTGSRGGNAALASLLTGLAGLGLITDSTTA